MHRCWFASGPENGLFKNLIWHLQGCEGQIAISVAECGKCKGKTSDDDAQVYKGKKELAVTLDVKYYPGLAYLIFPETAHKLRKFLLSSGN